MYMLLGTIFALGLLISVHEFGHFYIARCLGIRVLRFSIGFGKTIFSYTDKKGTEFVLSAIPLGGYVKMLSSKESHFSLNEEEKKQCFDEKPVFCRIAVAIAGPVANLLLAYLFVFVAFLVGKELPRPVIGTVEPMSVSALAGVQSNMEIISVNDYFVDDWQSIATQIIAKFGEKGFINLRTIDEDHKIQNFAIALPNWGKGNNIEHVDPIRLIGINPWQPEIPPIISYLDPKGPAAASNFEAGDEIISINNEKIKNWNHFVEELKKLPNSTAQIEFERQGVKYNRSVKLTGKQINSNQGMIGYFGAGIKAPVWPSHMVHKNGKSVLGAFIAASEKMLFLIEMTFDSIIKMATGILSVQNLSGPITIASVAGVSAAAGFVDFISFLALLSVSLGILNLMPIPALDGGHLLFGFIEWGRGRPLSEKIQMVSTQLGTAFIMGLMFLAVANDIIRLL